MQTPIHVQSATYINTPSRTEHLNALARKDCVALYSEVRSNEYGFSRGRCGDGPATDKKLKLCKITLGRCVIRAVKRFKYKVVKQMITTVP